jgi:hypothetical protein
MKFEIKNRFTGEIIFSHESEENSFSLTVKLAIEQKINLSRANLSRANLSRADLSDANLSDANLSRANLSDADLSDADLSRANLSRANLSRANLSRADLRWCVGNGTEILSMQVAQWKIAFTKTHLAIGCKKYLIEEWQGFSDEEIAKMACGALEWWKKWKDFIFQAIELSK